MRILLLEDILRERQYVVAPLTPLPNRHVEPGGAAPGPPRLAEPQTGVMHRPGDQLVPGTALAANKSRGMRVGYSLRVREQLPHRRTGDDGVHSQEISYVRHRSVHSVVSIFGQ